SRRVKYASLGVLVVQNASLVLSIRYVRTLPGERFLPSTAVVAAEAIKGCACLLLLPLQHRGGGHIPMMVSPWWWPHPCSCFHHPIAMSPWWWPRSSPHGGGHLLVPHPTVVATSPWWWPHPCSCFHSSIEMSPWRWPPRGVDDPFSPPQVTYQLKILTTALFSVLLLGTSLSRLQWFSLALLFAGVALVQAEQARGGATSGSNPEGGPPQSYAVGLAAVAASCLSSGFAGVYFEKLLKTTGGSIWVRNVQLGAVGTAVGLAAMLAAEGSAVATLGFFYPIATSPWWWPPLRVDKPFSPQVTYQLKILTTALFSVLLLGTSLSRLQWFSLALLFAGVALVQAEQARGGATSS
ncbi:PREDICTED: UDP-galactose translocator-like, partial [Calidris pugnax]|uniref:UDP-galactose translocator-like n=1 Tax=Calidris pugnax TaxID=198806 RepID=UPI00071D9AE2